MALNQSFNKDSERKMMLDMLKRLGKSEGMQFGSVTVSYELKYRNGSPYQYVVKDPIENSLDPKNFG